MNHYGLDMLLKAGVWTRDQWPVYEFSYLITNLTSPIFIAKSAVFLAAVGSRMGAWNPRGKNVNYQELSCRSDGVNWPLKHSQCDWVELSPVVCDVRQRAVTVILCFCCRTCSVL